MKKIAIWSLLVISLLVVGCGATKTPISKDVFGEKMSSLGMTIVDATDQFKVGDVESVSIAEGDGYQIEFYVVPSEDQAISAFKENQTRFELLKGSLSTSASKSIGNGAFYSLTTDDQYYFVSRIDNTFIYIEATKSKKEKIEEAIKLINY